MMKNIYSFFPLGKHSGFTLIELLVVVLIIGILAAIAVPQYEKAVAKAEFVQTRDIMYEIYRARQLYLMEGGSTSDQDLNNYPDLQLPAGATLGCVLGKKEDGSCVNGDSKIMMGNKSLIATGTAHAIKKGRIIFGLCCRCIGLANRDWIKNSKLNAMLWTILMKKAKTYAKF